MFKLIVKNKSAPSITGTSQTTTVNVGTTPSGPQGPEGPPGPRGYKGEASSVPGPKGEPGPRGYKGEDSYVPGPKGDTGPKGDKGDPFIYTDFTQPQLAALKGAKGDTGAKGSTGLKGDKGPKGDKGDTGSGAAWGNITGNIADQLDLNELYYTKAEADEQNGYFAPILEDLSKNGGYYYTTTTAYPNVNIVAGGKLSRSTATFGTAAGKDVGTAAGNVMEVGAFGLGSSGANPFAADGSDRFSHVMGSYDANYVAGAPTTYGGIDRKTYDSSSWIFDTYYAADADIPPRYRKSINGGEFTAWRPYVIGGMHTPANVSVNSIQAGIGAPKLAYKKLTGTLSEYYPYATQVPHGLNASKILAVDVTVMNTDGIYVQAADASSQSYFRLNTISNDSIGILVATSPSGSSLRGQPYKILITYEV